MWGITGLQNAHLLAVLSLTYLVLQVECIGPVCALSKTINSLERKVQLNTHRYEMLASIDNCLSVSGTKNREWHVNQRNGVNR